VSGDSVSVPREEWTRIVRAEGDRGRLADDLLDALRGVHALLLAIEEATVEEDQLRAGGMARAGQLIVKGILGELGPGSGARA
jgi:hypothetical protein